MMYRVAGGYIISLNITIKYISNMIKFRRKPGEAALVGTFTICFALISSSNINNHNFTEPPTILFILGVVLISLYFLFVEPIKQPQSYHNFADKRQFICSCHSLSEGIFLPPSNISTNENRRRGFIIPNFGDAVSNIVILAGGLFGVILLHICINTEEEVEDTRRWQLNICLPIMFYSTILISIGSTYYHCNPHDASLVWDRLPMTFAFVSIFCYMCSEYLPNHEGIESLLLPLIILGLTSVLYWRWTDDLRLYALVQFLPLLIIAGLLICYQPKHGGRAQHAFALICYALAKLCEDRDYEIFNLTHNVISGHSLKHVLAGIASISIASVLL